MIMSFSGVYIKISRGLVSRVPYSNYCKLLGSILGRHIFVNARVATHVQPIKSQSGNLPNPETQN